MPDGLPAQPNKSLQGGLDCLLLLASSDHPLGSTEAARALGMDRTRAGRLLGTLAHLGLATRTGQGKYGPGPGIHALAAMSLRGSNLLKAALPPIRALVEETGLTVALGVLWRRHVCYLYHGGPDKPVEAAIAGHNLYPAERSVIGQILLAYCAPEDVRKKYETEGRDAGWDLEGFLHNLLEARLRGYALGSNNLAVAIGDAPVAGLALSAGKRIPKRRIPRLVGTLQDARVAIERAM
jgi:DNA-binding IclR family transcriptional regulator